MREPLAGRLLASLGAEPLIVVDAAGDESDDGGLGPTSRSIRAPRGSARET